MKRFDDTPPPNGQHVPSDTPCKQHMREELPDMERKERELDEVKEDDAAVGKPQATKPAVARKSNQTKGNSVKRVADEERSKFRAEKKGAYERIGSKRRHLVEKKGQLEAEIAAVQNELWYTKPFCKDPDNKKSMSVADTAMLVVTALIFLGLLFIENSAGATQLVSLGAFNVTDMMLARGMLLVPAIVGLALSKASNKLPNILRFRIYVFCFFGLAFCVLSYCVSFAAQAGIFTNVISDGFDINLDESQEPGTESSQHTIWALIMFASSLTSLALTAMLFENVIDEQLKDLSAEVENQAHQILVAQELQKQSQLAKVENKIAKCDGKLHSLRCEEKHAVAVAISRFLIGMSSSILAFFALFQGVALAEEPITKAVFISPSLDREMRQSFFNDFKGELEWLMKTKEGACILVYDGVALTPIADFQAKGSMFQRKTALQRELTKLVKFLKETPKDLSDNRLDIPGLAQALPTLGLPTKSQIILVGTPLYMDSRAGGDDYFDMTEGFVPGGVLFTVSRELSVYSTKGREKNLESIYFSLVVPAKTKFVDDTHKQLVKETWANYVALQGGALINWTASYKLAYENANRGVSKALVEGPFENANEEMFMIEVDKEKVKKRVIRPRPLKDQVDEPKRDEFGNAEGSEFNLGQGGELSGKVTILVLCGGEAREDAIKSPLAKSIGKRIKVELLKELPEVNEFSEKISTSSQLWLWAGSDRNCLPAPYLEAILNRYQRGMGLFLLADNSPWTGGVESILKAIAKDSTIAGDYAADQILTANDNGPGFAGTHPLFRGITNLYEGNTVSSPRGSSLITLARSSDGNPLIALVKPRDRNGRVLVAGGFTMFMERFWNTAGTERFAQNAAAFLEGVEK